MMPVLRLPFCFYDTEKVYLPVRGIGALPPVEASPAGTHSLTHAGMQSQLQNERCLNQAANLFSL